MLKFNPWMILLLAFPLPSTLQLPSTLVAQQPPYDVVPEVAPPYYRVRYDASQQEDELDLPVQYTVWMPPGAGQLRGVIVHQHGCGEGSCKSGLTGAFDLHWQALAAKHACALLAASYEQPQNAQCSRWCDPRNGSDDAFQRCLVDLGKASGHPELATVPWALWGHSGGAYWSGLMTLLHPDRVAAAWLRSGAPNFAPLANREDAVPAELPDARLQVPVMLNLGTEEGVTVSDSRFAWVWPKAKAFFEPLRQQSSPIGIAVDPLTGHQCGNQRYLAIPWLDTCLNARLPNKLDDPLRDMNPDRAWLAKIDGQDAVPASEFEGDLAKSIWLPNADIAKAWMQYIDDTNVTDATPPPAPTNVQMNGGVLTWDAHADLESGIARFIIHRDGQPVATVPEQDKNPFGRPIFQGLQYSDTPLQPLRQMQWKDPDWSPERDTTYTVSSVNSAGLTSLPAEATSEKAHHLFILAGQSNMNGLKPEESFTPKVNQHFGAENVIVVKDALGGQPIRRWDRTWTKPSPEAPLGDLYDRLMTKVNAEIEDKPLRSITFLWMQGERDAREGNADVYAASFNAILNRLREDLGRDDINYVIGRLSDFGNDNAEYPDWNDMRTVLVDLADASPRGAWVNTDDLNDGKNRRGKEIANDLHYSAAGYVTFGDRLADAAIGLIGRLD